MKIPKPVPGMVVRYSYLWANESDAGRDEGVKDRPCAIVVNVQDVSSRERAIVLPITHSAPSQASEAIEIPLAVKQHLNLDDERSWIVLTEVNVFVWPGYDLRRTSTSDSPVYGVLPPRFFEYVRQQFLKRRNLRMIDRD